MHLFAPSSQEIRTQRERLWQELQTLAEPNGTFSLEAKSHVHRGQRGFFRNAGPYTLSVLANGGYDDEVYPDAALYHFPQSHQPSHDEGDISAAENCYRDGVPIFYVQRVAVSPARYHITFPALVTVVDHASRLLLLEFAPADAGQEEAFVLRETHAPYFALSPRRIGQARFRMDCILRYGLRGALCDTTEEAMLLACHVLPYAAQGSQDARNGLILNANHHLLFDRGIIQFSDTAELLVRAEVGPERFAEFGIKRLSLRHLPHVPEAAALRAVRASLHRQKQYRPVPPDWASGTITP